MFNKHLVHGLIHPLVLRISLFQNEPQGYHRPVRSPTVYATIVSFDQNAAANDAV